MLFESCVESLEAALASEAGGAGRVELCANLAAGGTTPATALVERAVAALAIPVFVMIRPRGGSFVYSGQEASAMEREIHSAAAAGAHGLVFGALTAASVVDTALMRRLIEAARPLPVTCHRAFDEARNLPEALDALLSLGVDRVLTSGGAPTAARGSSVIAGLVRQAGDALVAMAGGGVRADNVAALVGATGVVEVHAHLTPGTAPAEAGSAARWRDDVSALVAALRAATSARPSRAAGNGRR